MSNILVVLSVTLLCAISLAAWGESPPPEPTALTPPAAELPVTRIVLYSSGVGYFQRDGHIDGRAYIPLRFKVENINDLLKSMIVQDFDGGQITAVTYDSRDPITKTLKSFAIDLTEHPTMGQLLEQMRGERVEVAAPAPVSGVILGVETKSERVGDDDVIMVEHVNLLTDSGLRSLALAQIQQLQISNPQLNAELQQALALLAASHDRQKKTVLLTFDGTGKRHVRVAYIIETPVWKTSYRLVLSDDEAPFLQGWALVENTTDEDWHNVRLSLMSGRPISFIMDMYEPLYVERPVVVPEVYAALRPQVYEQALESADEDRPQRRQGDRAELDKRSTGLAGRQAFRELSPAAPPPPAAAPAETVAGLSLEQGVATAAQATEVGELFEYTITTPVSLARQKSAMLPIVNTTADGTKISIYNERVHVKYPLHGFRLHNATALHLAQGPITVFDDGRYAGDARLDDLPPGQERLISYALDLHTEVEPTTSPEERQLVTVSLRKGTLIATQTARTQKTYTIKNRAQKTKTVLIEHALRPDWQLIEPPAPVERTRDAYRFAVTIEAEDTAQLVVREEKPLRQTVQLTDSGTDVIAYYMRATQVSERVKEALQRVIDLRSRLEATRQQLARLEQQRQGIVDEQERIRQNISRLAQNSELYNRYVRKLDEQETSLEKLHRDIEALKNTEETQRQALETYLLQLDMD